MTKIIKVDRYFGGCPTCGGNDGYVNAGKGHFFFCREHRVSWFAGSNLFDSWREQTETEQREEYKQIEGFERIEEPLPEGIWSTDPDRERLLRERCEKVAARLVDALTPLAADIPEDGNVCISVRPQFSRSHYEVDLVLSAAGVGRRENSGGGRRPSVLTRSKFCRTLLLSLTRAARHPTPL